jgi:L-cysteine desulfidase
MYDMDMILALLKQEVAPALGCTEPAAVALACAHAAKVLGAPVQRLELVLSMNVLKNGMGVGIPKTGEVGLKIAAALGAVIADPALGLELLSVAGPDILDSAKELVSAGRITLSTHSSPDKVWIEAHTHSDNHSSRAIIRWRHNWLYLLEKDGITIEKREMDCPEARKLVDPGMFDLKDHFDFSMKVPLGDLESVDLGLVMNRSIAEYGLKQNTGIAVGRNIMEHIENGILGDDMHHYAMALTAAATDARMSGCSLPVITNTGSGNQGLSITLPIMAVAEKRAPGLEKLLRALALGHLVSVHIKNRVGLLSCLCGCLSAACGASCGIVVLLDGNYQQVEYAVKNMIGNTTGMVCDGAKEGCSLKVATNTSAAVQSALLAMSGICVSANDGIITSDIEETIDNLALFVNKGMCNADSTILDIMMNKNNTEV